MARRELAQVELTKQIEEEQAREGRKATIAKIAKALEKVWTDDLGNILITREDVDDLEHGEEVEVETNAGKVKEMRYPKVKSLVVRTNIFWTETKAGNLNKSTKSEATKRAITVSKRNGNQLELVGHFRSANEVCDHLGVIVGKDSATRVLQREGLFTEPYEGTDYTVAK